MWDTIKQILSKNSGTCIIIEEGQPSFVVTRFEEYQKLLENRPAPYRSAGRDSASEQELLEKINLEINNWKAKQSENNPDLGVPEMAGEAEIATEGEEGLRIENLPII